MKIRIKEDYAIQIVSVIIILFVSLWHIGDVYQIASLGDEFGYWTNAAYFAGYDWSGVSSLIPYYSYGYSLLLVPLLLIFDNAIIRYRMAVLINAFLYVMAYIISVKFGKKIFPNVNNKLIYIVSLVCALYSTNIYYTSVTFAEALIYFLYWLIVYSLFVYLKHHKIWQLLLLILEAGFLYVAHQRTIGVAVALMFVILMDMLRNCNNPVRRLVLALVCAAVMLCLIVYIKDILINNNFIWNDESLASGNDYAGQIKKLKSLVTVDGIVRLAEGYSGKLFYCIAVTGGVVIWGIIHSVKRAILCIEDKKTCIFNTYFFVVISLFMMLGVNAIFMLSGSRIDNIFYGRYSEFTVLPLFYIGAVYIVTEKPKIYELFIILGITLLVSVMSSKLLPYCENFVSCQCTALSIYYDPVTGIFNLGLCVKITILVILFIYLLCRCGDVRNYVIIAIIISSYWIITANYALDVGHINYQKRYSVIRDMANVIDNCNEYKDIYFLYDPKNDDMYISWIVCVIQSCLEDKKINLISEESQIDSKSGYFLIQENMQNVDESRYDIAEQGQGLVLLVEKNSKIQNRNEENKVYEWTMTNQIDKSLNTSTKYKVGYISSCQFLVLPSGEYEVTFDISANGLTDKYIADINIISEHGEIEFCNEPVIMENTEDFEHKQICARINLQQQQNSMEFRVYSRGNCELVLNEIKYKKVD